MSRRLFSSAAKPLKLYLDSLSQPCRALEIFLQVKKIPNQPIAISLGKMEHRSEGFAKINPFKKVPAIDDDGFCLTESIAIFRYICRRHNVEDHWYPKDSRQQAAVDEFLEWQHIGLRVPLGLYVWATFFTPSITGQPTEKNVVEEKAKPLNAALNQLNDIWLKSKPFVAGEDISIADLVGSMEVEMLKLTGFDPKPDRSALAGWLARVRDQTNPFYDESMTKINKITDKRFKKAS